MSPSPLTGLAAPPASFIPCFVPDHLSENFVNHVDHSRHGSKNYYLLYLGPKQGVYSLKVRTHAMCCVSPELHTGGSHGTFPKPVGGLESLGTALLSSTHQVQVKTEALPQIKHDPGPALKAEDVKPSFSPVKEESTMPKVEDRKDRAGSSMAAQPASLSRPHSLAATHPPSLAASRPPSLAASHPHSLAAAVPPASLPRSRSRVHLPMSLVHEAVSTGRETTPLVSPPTPQARVQQAQRAVDKKRAVRPPPPGYTPVPDSDSESFEERDTPPSPSQAPPYLHASHAPRGLSSVASPRTNSSRSAPAPLSPESASPPTSASSPSAFPAVLADIRQGGKQRDVQCQHADTLQGGSSTLHMGFQGSSGSHASHLQAGRSASAMSQNDPFFVSSTGVIHHSSDKVFQEIGRGSIHVVYGWDVAVQCAQEVVRGAGSGAVSESMMDVEE
ncbi:hypothetical protein DFH07DRAFT_767677 [Mycena maculata]|uniref:Uncharacterized protein n=1 Tax=Mycena maculata TaxID=230809 RepID=A0AAD7JX48_9AGAR|nr:hypothetical protein DFH07DRAFT_767677 [Mycena maculata]